MLFGVVDVGDGNDGDVDAVAVVAVDNDSGDYAVDVCQQVGPYDDAPKRPTQQSPLPYWQTEEGQEARKQDTYLRDNISITRNSLPPRLTSTNRALAQPGIPSGSVPGVYFASQQPAQGAVLNAAGAADGGVAAADVHDPSIAGEQSLRETSTRQQGVAGSANVVEYGYPELGHSQILGRKPASASIRSPVYDVYGQPRTIPPPLPPLHRAEEAVARINEEYLQAEGSVLRVPGGNTSSGQLLRASGKAAKQFSLTPAHVHFGTVPVGSVVHKTAKLRNVSTGHGRFSIDKPEPPLKVIYKPGGVAAGMDAVLTLEFAAQQPGNWVGELTVRTEMNILTLSASAKVVASADDQQALEDSQAQQ